MITILITPYPLFPEKHVIRARVQRFGDAAIATFHIRDGDLSRRTLVLRRSHDEWLIQHLHASNAPLEET